MVYMDTEKHIWLRWKPTFFASSFPSRTSSLTGNSSPSKRGNSGISNVAQDSTSLMLHTSVVVAKTSTASSSSQDVLPSFSESRETTGVTSGILAQCSWTIPMQRRGRGKLPNSLPWLGRFRKKTLAWCVRVRSHGAGSLLIVWFYLCYGLYGPLFSRGRLVVSLNIRDRIGFLPGYFREV